ncbi:radical SAM/SPASM domain-containing protein [Aliarcobacter cryaerophilus]|uniref:4Fe4S-binding SPASM domain-containing protein n=1 Tax=Aliarcobacter cryaerophilus TaxID=28198 RepID=A0A2S9THC6_9BACT|nr:radical SAM/SPASM domain-containing protein [Aliarcobacter cryaerophilus]PRM98221.1 hypothetical protein CJ670_04085 [Arcobacter cryaerophilus gv. crypticus]
MKIIQENYKLKNLDKIKTYFFYNKKKNSVVWGLSRKVKMLIEKKEFKVDYIIDKDIKLIGTLYKSIPIISFEDFLLLEDAILVILGNHVEYILADINKYRIRGEVYIVKEDLPSLFQITKEYLKNNYTIEEKKKLFKELVSMIEIEPHSYCNRTCWFCPNSFIDRRSVIKYMDLEILEQLLKDLASINYDKKIAFTRYSEPFGNEVFYDRLKLVSSYLPNAILHANTNSDFLNNETLHKAYSSGLRSLFIQIYSNENEEFDFFTIDTKAQRIIKRISDVDIKLDFIRDDWIEYQCTYRNMSIRMYARDFKKNGVNRSGIEVTNKEVNRTSPCTVVFTDVYIDYNSRVVPCCNIRSDNKEHKAMTFGKLTSMKNSIFEIYFSDTAIKWRNSLYNFNLKKKEPCISCGFSIVNKTNSAVQYVSSIID